MHVYIYTHIFHTHTHICIHIYTHIPFIYIHIQAHKYTHMNVIKISKRRGHETEKNEGYMGQFGMKKEGRNVILSIFNIIKL